MAKKIVPIDYTSRDFDSIRRNLIEHAKRYYPNSYKDFNKAGFGSLVLDTVSYVGDVLSYYLDHQANESFLETAAEYQNVIKLSRGLGYNFNAAPSSFGIIQFYALIPADTKGEPDFRYVPIIKAGSQVSNDAGATFTLMDDITFTSRGDDIQVARQNNGFATYYSVRGQGRVISGVDKLVTKTIGPFKKFLKVSVVDEGISEIVSVHDSDGNEFFQVDSLSQETIYKPVTNPKYDVAGSADTSDLLRKIAVPRRFTVQHNRSVSTLQFGHGSPLPDISGSVLDPSNVVIKRSAKTYYSDSTFDPTRLTNNDKMGVAPSNTTLTIRYRKNTQEFVNAAVGSIKNKVRLNIEFENESNLTTSVVDFIKTGIEVANEDAINGDVSLPTVEEIKMRAKSAFASQGRAVTAQDYVNMVYSMPGKFGMVKRARALRDTDALKRDINIYIVSQNHDGNLALASRVVKNNLKVYLNDSRVINDNVKILDAFIVNYGVEYSIAIRRDANQQEVLASANSRLRAVLSIKMQIGEPIYLGDMYSELKKISGILDVIEIKIVNKNKISEGYSAVSFDVARFTSADGSIINTPNNYTIFEMKFPNRDIKGTIL